MPSGPPKRDDGREASPGPPKRDDGREASSDSPSHAFASLLRAPNPGPMTLDGTNTWVLRGPGSGTAVVVDPGPADEGHLAAVAAAGPIELIMLTHRHLDHSEGVPRLLELLDGVPVAAADPALCRGAPPLTDGDRIEAAGVTIEVIAT